MAIEIAEKGDIPAPLEHKKKSKKHRRQEAEAGGLYVIVVCYVFGS